MTAEQILALINRNPAFFLATSEDGAPRVRGMLLYRADAAGLVFHTGAMKELHAQLQREPRVELCFNDWQQHLQVRVRGVARSVADPQLAEEIVASPGREFLKPWLEERGYDQLVIYRVEQCRATVWSMASNFDPKAFVTIST